MLIRVQTIWMYVLSPEVPDVDQRLVELPPAGHLENEVDPLVVVEECQPGVYAQGVFTAAVDEDFFLHRLDQFLFFLLLVCSSLFGNNAATNTPNLKCSSTDPKVTNNY